ncbi:MAG: Crp/Fnr family transcriptional regulator [Acidobacteriota bacterium]
MAPPDPPQAARDTIGASLFTGIEPAEYDEIRRRAVTRRFQPDEAIFHEGEPAAAVHVVATGRVKLTQNTAEGHEVVIRFLGPGDALAAVAAVAGAAYPATAWTQTECQLLLWPHEVFTELLLAHPRLAGNVIRLLSERLGEMQERFRELATERVAQRIARALSRLVRQAGRRVENGVLIDLPLSRQSLAEMTGTTLYTVSRILSEWESRGFVDSSRERVVICQPHALVVIAEDLPPPPTHP